MLKIGLTGGIGCGKSTAINAFRALGVPVIDADKISKNLVNKGNPALTEISKCFGREILLSNGELDRAKLKKIVFSNAQSLEKLETIIHPYVRLEIIQRISRLSGYPYVVVDIPLLVEKNYMQIFDRIIVVDCLPEQQISRVLLRDTLDEPTLKSIIKKQASREERLAIATDKLDNSAGIKTLNKQIKKLHADFLNLERNTLLQ